MLLDIRELFRIEWKIRWHTFHVSQGRSAGKGLGLWCRPRLQRMTSSSIAIHSFPQLFSLKNVALGSMVLFFDLYDTVLLANLCVGGRPGGRIHGHWPGNAAHLNCIRRSPRWEDFEYEPPERKRSKNRLSYWGMGGISKNWTPSRIWLRTWSFRKKLTWEIGMRADGICRSRPWLSADTFLWIASSFRYNRSLRLCPAQSWLALVYPHFRLWP